MRTESFRASVYSSLIFTWLISLTPTSHGGIAVKDRLFKSGATINFCFFETNLVTEKLVKDVAVTWTRYANVKFNFLQVPCSQLAPESISNLVRIKYDFEIGNSSFIGTGINKTPIPNATMWLRVENNATGLNPSQKAAILHEFGHVLGLDHEHFHPSIQKEIDANVIKICQEIKGWSEEDCQYNLISPYEEKELYLEKFDAASIMLYNMSDYGSKFAAYKRSMKLSAKDIAFIKKLYPRISEN